MSTRLCPSGGSRGESISWLFQLLEVPASLSSWPLPLSSNPAAVGQVFLTPSLTPVPSSRLSFSDRSEEWFSAFKDPPHWVHPDDPGPSPISKLTALITGAKSLCHGRWHIHRFGALGCGYIWGAYYSADHKYPQLPKSSAQALQPSFQMVISLPFYIS